MMPQQEANESVHEPTDAYGRYEGAHTYHPYEQPLRDSRLAEKTYPKPSDNKNMLRLMMFLIAMAMLLICAVLFIFFMGGTGGWIGFVVAAGVIFLITVVAIDKIQ